MTYKIYKCISFYCRCRPTTSACVCRTCCVAIASGVTCVATTSCSSRLCSLSCWSSASASFLTSNKNSFRNRYFNTSSHSQAQLFKFQTCVTTLTFLQHLLPNDNILLIHACIVWLTVLTCYLIIVHIARRRVHGHFSMAKYRF